MSSWFTNEKRQRKQKTYRKITNWSKVVKKRMTELQFSSSSPAINSPVQQFNRSKPVVRKGRDNTYKLVLILYIYISRCLMINLVVLFFACFFNSTHVFEFGFVCLLLFHFKYFKYHSRF